MRRKKTKKTKVPRGTKKNPWHKVPEEFKNGKPVKWHYVRITKNGVWKVDAVPPDAIVKQGTSY